MLMLRGNEIRNEDLILDTATAAVPATGSLYPTAEWDIRPLDEVISKYVNAAVSATGGNVRKAARQLQISPSTLYTRMK